MMKVKCLLVDDLDDNLVALTALLRQDDVEILTARSGEQALEILLAHDIALAFLDVQMPEMDGFQLAELMRGSDRTRQIPIIFVTAGNRDTQRLFKGYESGAVDFLYKPVEPRILKNKADVFFQLYRQRQQLAAELHQRSETLRINEMFIAMLGHDLRNPLHAINLSVAGLQRASVEPVVQKLTARIESSGKRMHRMIEDLLDLVRVRMADGIPLRREPSDLGDVVDRVVMEHRVAAPDHVIDISRRGSLSGNWDSGRLEQVVSNLVGNAIQHGSAQSGVILMLDGSDPAAVTLSISNAGQIPEEIRSTLFNPFSGVDRRMSRERGLGLGLYIVDHIVRAHGGSVDVQARDADSTCFLVHLPR